MKNKWIIAVVVGFVLLLVITYWVGKSYGKSLPPKQTNINDDVNSDGNLPQNVLSDMQVQSIADRIFEDIKGWTVNHDDEPYTEAIKANDIDLNRIYNYWNNKYYSKWKQDLIEAMKGEKYGVIQPTADVIIIRLENIRKSGK